jgi:hypothetical protein
LLVLESAAAEGAVAEVEADTAVVVEEVLEVCPGATPLSCCRFFLLGLAFFFLSFFPSSV